MTLPRNQKKHQHLLVLFYLLCQYFLIIQIIYYFDDSFL